VLIVDDHPVVRDGLKLLLDSRDGFQVVGEATTGEEAVRLACDTSSDVILMDLMMPVMDGIEATRRILESRPHARVLVLTSFGGDEQLFPALDAGALGFLLKDATADELVRAIRQVAQGLSSLSPPVARRLVRRFKHGAAEMPADKLTPREIEILRELAHGESNEGIGRQLHISPATVRTHLNQIFAKLGLTRRTQAVLYALKNGIAHIEHDAGPR
jgi:DNA-binding NarL/FixJ family response regulator